MSTQSHLQQNNQLQTTSAVPVDIVLPFTAINHTSLPIAGGKAANLGELTQAGLPVPPGFCVTTSAYELVAEGADLESILAKQSGNLESCAKKLLDTANPNGGVDNSTVILARYDGA